MLLAMAGRPWATAAKPGMILTLLSYDVKTKVAATTNKAADSTKGVTIAFAAQ
jgi:hypothetical protein